MLDGLGHVQDRELHGVGEVSLLNPSPADMIDRVTILSLKIEKGLVEGKPVAHWEEERGKLVDHLVHLPLDLAKGARVAECVHSVAAINALIWHREEEIRRWIPDLLDPEYQESPRMIAELAAGTRKLADRRHDLLRLIDQAFGVERREKI